MLKLMKYEFRKLRTTLLIMVGSLAALEAGFIAGMLMNRNGLAGTCLALIMLLVFLVYAYIVLAGMASYSRELKEKSGYLIFMAPVTPMGVVLSKLVFTVLAALGATALFALTAYLDVRYLIGRLGLDPETLNSINLVLRFGLKSNADVFQLIRMMGFAAVTVLIEIVLTMCCAYLAITLSATLLQNRKGFLRGLISLVLFFALTWLSNWAANTLIYNNVSLDASFAEMRGAIGWSLLLNLGLSAVFAGASAWLLDRKVNL